MKHFTTFSSRLLIVAVIALLTMAMSSVTWASSITSNGTGGGNWSTTTTWNGGVVPGPADNVTIADGDVVTIDTSFNVASLTVGGGTSGTLGFNAVAWAHKDTVTGGVIVNYGASFLARATPSVTADTLFLAGDLTNNGTLDFCRGVTGASTAQGICAIVFNNKTGDQQVQTTGTPTRTRFWKVYLVKGTRANRVVATIGVSIGQGTYASGTTNLFMLPFRVNVNPPTGSAGTWEQNAGRLFNTKTFSVSNLLTYGNYQMGLAFTGSGSYIDSTGSTYFGVPTTINTSDSIINSSGVGSLADEDTVTLTSGTLVGYGTAFAVNSYPTVTSAVLFTMNGGAIVCHSQGGSEGNNAAGYNVFQVQATTKFVMNSGTVTIVDPNAAAGSGREISIPSGVASGTAFNGGTVYIGDGVTSLPGAQGFRIYDPASIPLNNLVVQGGGGAWRRGILLSNVSVNGTLTVASGSVLCDSTYTLTAVGAVANSGTVTDSTGGEVKLAGGSGSHAISGGGSFTNLELNDALGAALSNDQTIAGTLTLTSGAFSIGANTLTCGPFSVTSGTLTGGSSSNLTIAGSASGINLPSSLSSLNNLTINNSNGITLQGPLAIGGTLTLGGNKVTTGSNTLTINSGGTVSRTTGYVIGNLQEAVTGSSATFDVGTANGYTPVLLTNVLGSDNVTAAAVQGADPHASGSNLLQRYWTLSKGPSLTQADLEFDYLGGDVVGNEANYSIKKYSPSTWTAPGGSIDAVNHKMTIAGVTGFSDWTASQCGISLADLTGGTVGTAYDQTAAASGGAAPYAYSVTSGVLPAWATLNHATGEITGMPNAAGSASFTITVTDFMACTDSRAYSISFPCPTITLGSLSGGTVGTVYSGSAAASGGTSPYTYAVTIGTLPKGLSLNTGTGAVTGTPDSAGTYNFTIQATDPYSCTGSQGYSLAFPCPTITLGSLSGGTVGTAYTGQSAAASGGTSPYTYAVTSGTFPKGLSLNTSTGAVTGTPDSAGTYNFTIQATDADGCTGSLAYSLTFSCPTITVLPASLPVGQNGVAYLRTISASGGTAPYTYIVDSASLPTGLTLSHDTISGTPTVNGTFGFNIKATDADGCFEQVTYSIIISSCPVLTFSPTDLPNGSKNFSYNDTISVSGNAGPFGYTETGTLPTGVTLAANGVLSGTPTQAGVFPITVTVHDTGNGCSQNNDYVLVICGPISMTPFKTGVAYSAYVDSTTASGGTAPYTFVHTTGTLPAGLSLSSNGHLTGTPTVAKIDTFEVMVTDSKGCVDSAQFITTINCPTIIVGPEFPAGVTGNAYSAFVTASGGTAPYTFTPAGTLPAGLALSPNASHDTLRGIPTAAGEYTFTISVTDAEGCSAVFYDTVEITCPAITFTGGYTSGKVGVPYKSVIAATGGHGPYAYAKTSGNLPDGLALSHDTLSGTPTNNGVFTFDVTATDAYNCTGIYHASVTIGTCVAATLGALPADTQGVAYAVKFVAGGGTAPYVYALGAPSLPTGLQVRNDSIIGTPTVPGMYHFAIQVTDSNGCITSVPDSILINCPIITVTTASLPNGAINVAYSQVLAASGGTGPYSYTKTGTLPTGLILSTGGTLSGTPTVGGYFTDTVTAADAHGCAGSKIFSFMISGPAVFRVANVAKDTLYWDSTSTWVIESGGSVTGVPHSQDHVYLDNNHHPGSYVVKVGVDASGNQFSDTAATIYLGYAHNPNKITLLIPTAHNTYYPGAFYWGDGVAGNYDMVIDTGGLFQNSSTCGPHNAFNYPAILPSGGTVSVDSLLIKKGGKYLHNSMSFGSGIFGMSHNLDGDYGTVEYDVPSSFSDVNGQNYWYPNLVFSNTHGAPTYYVYSGGNGAMYIKGNLTTNPGATDSIGLTPDQPTMLYGNIVNNGTTKFIGGPLMWAGSVAQTISGTPVSMNAGAVVMNNAGVNLQSNLNVTGGTVQASGNYTYVLVEIVAGLATPVDTTVAVGGVITTGADTLFLTPAGIMSEGTNTVQGNVSSTRVLSQGINANFGNGFQMDALGGVPGTTTVFRKTGVADSGYAHNKSILRHYDVTASNNTGLNATIVVGYAPTELNGISQSNLLLLKSADYGTTWAGKKGTLDSTVNHQITATGVPGPNARWTMGSAVAPMFVPHTIVIRSFKDTTGTVAPQVAQKWRLALYQDSVSVSTLISSGFLNSGVLATPYLASGTYILAENDSTNWVHVGKIHHGTSIGHAVISGSMRFDTLVVTDASVNSADTVDFINQMANTITVVKLRDLDANLSTTGDQSPRKWHLSLYKDSVSVAHPVAQADTSLMVVTNLAAGKYIAAEADSGAPWYRLNGNGTRYDTLTVLADQSIADTFINVKGNTLWIQKYEDKDGNFATTGDRVLKSWYFTVQDSATGAFVDSGSGTGVPATKLGDGAYYVFEADSAGWVHIGYVVNGTGTASGANHFTVRVSNAQVDTVAFVNAPPIYSQMFRSFRADSIASAGQPKTLVNVKKPDKVQFSITVVNDSANVTKLHMEFAVAVDSSKWPFTITPYAQKSMTDTKGQKWDFLFGSPLSPSTPVTISGWGTAGKVQTAKYQWFRGATKIPKTAISVAATDPRFTLNQPHVPMPNRLNVLTQAYADVFDVGGSKTGGMMIGVENDTLKGYLAWVVMQTPAKVTGSLYVSPDVQNGTARGLDFKAPGGVVDTTKWLKGAQTSLSPKAVQDNALFGALVALKLSIGASYDSITPPGLGELIYNDGTSNPLNSMQVKAIALQADTLMTGYVTYRWDTTWTTKHTVQKVKLTRIRHYADAGTYANLAATIFRIDSAFEGPMDTVSFAGASGLMTKGTRRLMDVGFLHADPSIQPSVNTKPRVPVAAEVVTPVAYTLYQNYPNPFNPTTTIRFDLPQQAVVTLKIYNILGQEVATLFDRQQMDIGTQEVQFDASRFASGVYFYRMIAEGMNDAGMKTSTFVTVKKMLMIK